MYFTHSRSVDRFRDEHGEPDVIQVRRTFKTAKQATHWEEKVIRRLMLVKSEKWLNNGNGGKEFCCIGHTEETRKKMSAVHKGHPANNKGKPQSEATRMKIAAANRRRWQDDDYRAKHQSRMISLWQDDDYRAKQKVSRKGRVSPSKRPEVAAKIAASNRGKKKSEESKEKLRKTMSGIRNPMSNELIRIKHLESVRNEEFRNRQSALLKGTMTAFNTQTKRFVRISTEEFYEHRDIYSGPNSKFAIEHKLSQ